MDETTRIPADSGPFNYHDGVSFSDKIKMSGIT